jgi:hypothetical protein
MLWALCSFEMFDLLHGDRRLSLDDTIERTVTTVERALCRPTRRSRRRPPSEPTPTLTGAVGNSV